jgi:hypothetical protein
VRALCILLLVAAGCDDGSDADAGMMDAGSDADAGPRDAGGDTDDAGMDDAGIADAGMIDGGSEMPLSPYFGDIVINELLIDGTTEGDPNGDGDASPVEDQFVEMVNVSGAGVPMGEFTIVEADFPDLPRHTFATFTLDAGEAVVVFGGGDAPDATATATFFTANAADPGIPFGLHLSEADHLLLLDDGGALVAELCYGGTGTCDLAPAADESLTRSPDLTGGFVPHRGATGSDGAAFSVGTQVDGTAF